MAAALSIKISTAVFLLALWVGPPADADTVFVDKGREVYLSYGCAVCHGKNGDGKGISSQQLYPPPTDLSDPKAYRLGSDKGRIRLTILGGIKGESSVMPAFKDMDSKELEQLIEYLLLLQGKTNQ